MLYALCFMTIGIDASRAFQEKRTGIEEYSYQVIKSLMNKLDDHRVILYVRPANYEFLTNIQITNKFVLPENWEVKMIRWPYFWTQIGLSLELLFHPIDVLFIPAHTVPIVHPKNTIVTIHGLEYEFCPKAYSFWAKLYMRYVIKNSVRWAKTIIAVSNNTKNDLAKLYGVFSEKIKVVYEGVSMEHGTWNMEQKNIKHLLFIGRLEERKNICGIIEAFEILKEKYKISHKLVLVGKPGYGWKNTKIKMQKSKYRKDISLKGFVDDEEKQELLKNADVFLFPSFYEGFGLPILEAQAVGVPVVTSNISSMPEVVDLETQLPLWKLSFQPSSAILVNPNNSEEIAESIYKLISDKNLRDNVIKRGLENVKRFSWERCAEEISKLLIG